MNPKDWKTTVLGILAGVLIVAGILWPDKINPETQATVNAAFTQIITGLGGLLAVYTGLRAKD